MWKGDAANENGKMRRRKLEAEPAGSSGPDAAAERISTWRLRTEQGREETGGTGPATAHRVLAGERQAGRGQSRRTRGQESPLLMDPHVRPLTPDPASAEGPPTRVSVSHTSKHPVHLHLNPPFPVQLP